MFSSHSVRIHINREVLQVPPIRPPAKPLYALADIPKHEKVYREVRATRKMSGFRAMRPRSI